MAYQFVYGVVQYNTISNTYSVYSTGQRSWTVSPLSNVNGATVLFEKLLDSRPTVIVKQFVRLGIEDATSFLDSATVFNVSDAGFSVIAGDSNSVPVHRCFSFIAVSEAMRTESDVPPLMVAGYITKEGKLTMQYPPASDVKIQVIKLASVADGYQVKVPVNDIFKSTPAIFTCAVKEATPTDPSATNSAFGGYAQDFALFKMNSVQNDGFNFLFVGEPKITLPSTVTPRLVVGGGLANKENYMVAEQYKIQVPSDGTIQFQFNQRFGSNPIVLVQNEHFGTNVVTKAAYLSSQNSTSTAVIVRGDSPNPASRYCHVFALGGNVNSAEANAPNFRPSTANLGN